MFDILRKSLAVGIVTETARPAPGAEPAPGRGRPEIDFAAWADARPAAAACPTGALACAGDTVSRTVTLDLGKCTFCGLCAEADPRVRMSRLTELAARQRADLITTARYALKADGTHEKLIANQTAPAAAGPAAADAVEALGNEVKRRIDKALGRSLHIREVDAGSCNGCEIEVGGLNCPVYDVERFGIHFVASPRYADMLLVTGPVSRNMELALRKTYDATPEPRLVVAAGACACGGGIFGCNYASLGGVEKVLPVDVFIPGCPPSPRALLQGIFLALGKRW